MTWCPVLISHRIGEMNVNRRLFARCCLLIHIDEVGLGTRKTYVV